MSPVLKIIHRSIVRELGVTFLLTLAFLNSVLMMEKMVRLSKLLAGIGSTAGDMLKIIIFLQPQLLLLTIPMSLLLATLLVYGRLNLDSETVILKACGMNFMAISRPVVLLGISCFVLSCLVSLDIGPKSSARLREELSRIIAVRSSLAIEEGTFNTAFKDIVIIVKGKKPTGELEDIFIYDNRGGGDPKVLMAREGAITSHAGGGLTLTLKKGSMVIAKEKNTTELYFDAYRLHLSLDLQAAAPKKIEFTPAELLRKAGTADDVREKAGLYLELHRRISLPAVCLILIFLGPPLAMLSGKSGRLGGLAVGLIAFTVYYMALIYGENLVMAGKLNHIVGAWLSPAVFAVSAVVLFSREASR